MTGRLDREIRSVPFGNVAGVDAASLDMMLWPTLNRRAKSACVAVPAAARAFSASCFWCGVSFAGRPMWTPFALARAASSVRRGSIRARTH